MSSCEFFKQGKCNAKSKESPTECIKKPEERSRCRLGILARDQLGLDPALRVFRERGIDIGPMLGMVDRSTKDVEEMAGRKMPWSDLS